MLDDERDCVQTSEGVSKIHDSCSTNSVNTTEATTGDQVRATTTDKETSNGINRNNIQEGFEGETHKMI
jgi:hypothetical protein